MWLVAKVEQNHHISSCLRFQLFFAPNKSQQRLLQPRRSPTSVSVRQLLVRCGGCSVCYNHLPTAARPRPFRHPAASQLQLGVTPGSPAPQPTHTQAQQQQRSECQSERVLGCSNADLADSTSCQLQPPDHMHVLTLTHGSFAKEREGCATSAAAVVGVVLAHDRMLMCVEAGWRLTGLRNCSTGREATRSTVDCSWSRHPLASREQA